MRKGGTSLRRRWQVVVPVAAAAVLALGAAGWAVFLRPSGSASASGVTYRTTSVTTGTIKQSVTATGTIAAASTEDLSFSASGEVTAVYVAAGQKVAKGQKLATIDSASLKSSVAAAEASLASAQARLASDEDADATDAQIASDKANVTVDQKQVTAAKSSLAGATLTSPIAGTVTSVGLTVGQQVSGGSSSSSSGASSSGGSSGSGSSQGGGSSSSSSSSTSSSSTIEVISTGSYVISASVDASDVALIKKGNQVVITPSDSTTNVFGLVSSVGLVATSSSGVASFPVVVDVTGSPTGLYAGATASLEIVYKQLSNVLEVPIQAVTMSNGQSTVQVSSGSNQEKRTVVTGLSSGGMIQIKSGLKAGEQVLVAQRTATRSSTGSNSNSNSNRGGYGGGYGGGAGGYGGGFGGGAGGFGGGTGGGGNR